MHKDPDRITVEQVRSALEALGMERDVSDFESLTIDIDQVVIVRRRRGENGGMIVNQGRNMLATVSTEIPLVRA